MNGNAQICERVRSSAAACAVHGREYLIFVNQHQAAGCGTRLKFAVAGARWSAQKLAMRGVTEIKVMVSSLPGA